MGDNNVLALILDAPEITNRHDLLKQRGFQFDYTPYTPHMSLKYAATDTDNTIMQHILREEFNNNYDIIFHNETWREI